MGILNIVFKNMRHRPRTRRVYDLVPYPRGYRGMLAHQANACTGCKICAYVCAPGGITFDEQDGRPHIWAYDSEKCSFCGRCVDYCPTGALSFADRPPEVTGDRSLYRVEHRIPWKECVVCGKAFLPMPQELLARQYPGGNLPYDVTELNELCPACRRKAASQHLREQEALKQKA